MHEKVVNPLDIANWDEALLQLPGATAFHTQGWARVLSDTYGYKPKYIATMKNDKLSFVLPVMEVNSVATGRRAVSLPFTDFVPPSGLCPTSIENLWDTLVKHAARSRWHHIDLRTDIGFHPDTCIYDSFYQHEIRISDNAKEMLSGFSRHHRRNIQKAMRESVVVEVRHDMKAVDEFCYLNTITRKRHGVPPQPHNFFMNLHKHIISQGKGIVVVAKKDKCPVAAGIFIFLGKNAIYKYSASQKNERQLRANNLVMWEAIQWLARRGCEHLCLGRTDKDNEGLVRYKMGWGAEQKTMNYYRYLVKADVFVAKKKKRANTLSTKFFRSAPSQVSNILGEILYRHVG